MKFYLTLLLGSLLLLVIGAGPLIVFIKHYNSGVIKPKDQLIPFFSAGIFILACYTIYRYYKNAPKIQVDNLNISFNNQPFAFSDLKDIELTGKRNFPYLLSFPMEAATLRFKNGETRYIFDDMYENSWQLKSFLKQVIIDKTNLFVQPVHHINKWELDGEYYDTFKGNQFISLRGILLWGSLGVFTYAILVNKKADKTNSFLLYIFFSIVWFFIHSATMDYFKVSQTFFVIKNHNFLWRTKAYRLSDIKEIVYETRGKMPNCLRVITNDFRNKLYLAGTLSDKTWLELKDKLESNNIKVRNECIG